MARPLSLEHLPTEIQILIMRSAPDVATLLALIAASPKIFRMYLAQRDQTIVAVIRNQLGRNWSKAIQGIGLSSTSHDSDYQVSIDQAKSLYKLDKLVHSLIQQCIDIQPNIDTKLSRNELERIRRGIYTLNVATRLSDNQTDFVAYCEDLAPLEILESLYILNCFRNLAKAYVVRVEDFVLKKIIDGTLHPVWRPEESMYLFFDSETGYLIQAEWISNAPWLLDLQKLHDITTSPISLDDMYDLEPDWDNDPPLLQHDELMKALIPATYRFDETHSIGMQPPADPILRERYRNVYLDAIPLGYMIWDDSRIAQTWWKDRLPASLLPSEIEVPWRKRGLSVESRLRRSHPDLYIITRSTIGTD